MCKHIVSTHDLPILHRYRLLDVRFYYQLSDIRWRDAAELAAHARHVARVDLKERQSINTRCVPDSALSLASKQIYEETIDIVRKHRFDPCPHRQFTISLAEIWNRYEADAKYTRATADYPSVLSWALPQDDYLVEKTMRARMFWLEDKYAMLTTKLPGSGSFGPRAARDGLSADDPEMLTFRVCSLLGSKTARRIGRSSGSHSQWLLPERTPSGYSGLWDKWCRKNESVVDMLDWLSGRT